LYGRSIRRKLMMAEIIKEEIKVVFVSEGWENL
jgi:hypothetical protein